MDVDRMLRRMKTMHGQRLGVLVGVDRSECSQVALDWAAQDAARGGLRLTVAHVIDLARIADVPPSSELAAAATRGGRGTVDTAVLRSPRTPPGANMGRDLASGTPATELLRLAAGA